MCRNKSGAWCHDAPTLFFVVDEVPYVFTTLFLWRGRSRMYLWGQVCGAGFPGRDVGGLQKKSARFRIASSGIREYRAFMRSHPGTNRIVHALL